MRSKQKQKRIVTRNPECTRTEEDLIWRITSKNLSSVVTEKSEHVEAEKYSALQKSTSSKRLRAVSLLLPRGALRSHRASVIHREHVDQRELHEAHPSERS